MKNFNKGFKKGINALLASGATQGFVGSTGMSWATSIHMDESAEWTNNDWDGFSKELYKKLKDEYK